MFEGLFTWLLATFVIDPVQAELGERMQAARAPAAIVQQVQTCVAAATPALFAKAVDAPWWSLSTSIGVAVGMTDATAVLAETSPQCAAAIAAVKPFLASSGA